MKLIPLSQGEFAQVDDEDFEYLMQWKWYAHKRKLTHYAGRNLRLNKKKVIQIQMHRLVMKAEAAQMIDHKDRSGLNNQKNNLRFCTQSQNNANKRKRSGTSSKYRGVNLCKKSYNWIAHIAISGKLKHIGIFKTEENAAIAYNIFAEKEYGEFANLNT